MLPKLSHPTFDVVIPTTKEKIKVRPMLVKEEKILLIAKQSEDRAEQLNAIKQVCNNCIVTPNVKVDDLAFVDMEYLFLKIRSFSISNKTKVSYRDNEDEKVYNFELDFDKVETKQDSDANPVIDLGDNISLVLKYPPVSVYTDKEFFNLADDKVFETILLSSMTKIFENDKAYDCKTVQKTELLEFINSIPAKQYEKIQEFFNSVPTLYYAIEYKNEKGTERKIELRSLDDFFTFG